MIHHLCRAVRSRLERRRQQAELHKLAAAIFPGQTVLAGPFAGLKYPDWKCHGSAIFPKLLGSYEAELHGFIERVLGTNPSTVVDIGCAEGYYAVGCALRSPDLKVVAADISPQARALCSQLAHTNGVGARVAVTGRITRNELLQLAAESGGWIICDCEGGELELFDEEVFRKLADWHLLIEMHEYIVPGIEERLAVLAGKTHNIETIDSVDDYRRQRLWASSCVANLPDKLRFEFYYEGRPGLMRWLCACPKRT